MLMLNELPCMVCGDESAGINFGAITCQECYEFFRNTHFTISNNEREEHHDFWKSYVCSSGETCVVDRRNKERCNYCRYQKCDSVGMECAVGFRYEWRAITFRAFMPNVASINRQTCRSPEIIQMHLNKPQDDLWLIELKSMTYEEQWTFFSKLINNMLEWAYDFVNHLSLVAPFFGEVATEPVVKGYSFFELFIVRISRLIDLDRDLVLCENRVVPINECVNACLDPLDKVVLSGMFDAAKTIARLKLTEEELAVYLIVVLWRPERYTGVRTGTAYMITCHYAAVAALREAIQKSHAPAEGDDSIMQVLLDLLFTLNSLAAKHEEAVVRFEEVCPDHTYDDAEYYATMYSTIPDPREISTDLEMNDSPGL